MQENRECAGPVQCIYADFCDVEADFCDADFCDAVYNMCRKCAEFIEQCTGAVCSADCGFLVQFCRFGAVSAMSVFVRNWWFCRF